MRIIVKSVGKGRFFARSQGVLTRPRVISTAEGCIGRSGMGKVMVKHLFHLNYVVISDEFGGEEGIRTPDTVLTV